MTARLSPQREAEIRNRCLDEVTSGPWLVSEDQNGKALVYVERPGREGNVYASVLLVADWASEADVQFVASARRSVPELLAELAAVRAERDEARRQLDATGQGLDAMDVLLQAALSSDRATYLAARDAIARQEQAGEPR